MGWVLLQSPYVTNYKQRLYKSSTKYEDWSFLPNTLHYHAYLYYNDPGKIKQSYPHDPGKIDFTT